MGEVERVSEEVEMKKKERKKRKKRKKKKRLRISQLSLSLSRLFRSFSPPLLLHTSVTPLFESFRGGE